MAARVRLADVAAAAGVSTAMVSYVLNDRPGHTIPEATRARVREAAEALGYTPSSAARTLARGRSDIVLLLVPELPLGHVLVGVMERLTRGCTALGLQLLARLPLPGEDLAHLCRTLMPAAVVVLVDVDPQQVGPIRALGVPVARWQADADATVGPDDVRAPTAAIGRLQAETLVARGHSRLAFIGPADPRLRVLAGGRFSGVRDACAQQGLPAPREYTVARQGATADQLRDWVADGATGLCVYNDDLALSVLAAARAAGIEVPRDLAVIGVDDIPAGRWTEPPLATIALDLDAVSGGLLAAVAAALGMPWEGPADGGQLEVRLRASVG